MEGVPGERSDSFCAWQVQVHLDGRVRAPDASVSVTAPGSDAVLSVKIRAESFGQERRTRHSEPSPRKALAAGLSGARWR